MKPIVGLGLAHARNRAAMLKTAGRARRLARIRPTSLASPLLRLLAERRIIEAEGLRLFVDPTSHLGQSLLASGTYEPETIALFRANLRPGDAVLDIGANEGFFAALAATLVGSHGCVIAVEPQSRLADVLEINLALNGLCGKSIVPAVVAESDGGELAMTLFPISNTGASSLVRTYSFGARSENVTKVTPAAILEQCGLDRIDFAKVDVEGFEPEVIRGMAPLLERGAIGTLLLDYHGAVLKQRGIDPGETHRLILARGMTAQQGDPGSGYVLYRRTAAAD